MYRNNIKLNQGSVLVELAIVMPLVLAILLFIYWFFLTLTWQQALKDAVVNAVDLAQSRGDPVSMGEESRYSSDTVASGSASGLADPIDKYVRGASWTNSLGMIHNNPGLLASGNNSDLTETDPEPIYNSYVTSQGWSGNTLRDFDRQTLYAMAYAYSSIKVKAGTFVKYPCDPNGTADGEGPGCVICGPAQESVLGEPGPTYNSTTATLFGIECKMQPMDNILTPMIRMLGISGAMDLTMTATAIEENQRDVWQ